MNNENIKQFLIESAQNDDFLVDVGYLLIPSDDELNSQAMCNLKKKFGDWVTENGIS